MILVAVREDDRVEAAGRVAQVGEVGQHEVDAEHLVAREREAAVDQDAALALLDHGHVVADLAEAAERDDAYDSLIAAAVRPLAARAERGDGASLVGRLDQRQARPADAVAEQLERGLDRDRVDRTASASRRGELAISA